MNCSRCNAPIANDSRFCTECGAPVVVTPAAPAAPRFCPACGAPQQPNTAFCSNCGTRFGAPAAATPAPQAAPRKPVRIPFKALAIAAAAVAVIAAAVLAFPLLSGGSGDSYVAWLSDDEYQIAQLPKAEEHVLLSQMHSDYGSPHTTTFYAQLATKLSNDGKKLFYADNFSNNDTFTLYCRDLTRKNASPLQIDSGISFYKLNKTANLVTYTKDHTLYQHDLKHREIIAENVHQFYVSDDGRKLLYLLDYNSDYGGTLYLKNGNSVEQLASGVSSISYASDDLSLIWYVADSSLYRMTGGKNPEQIASDVHTVHRCYDSGECYYSTQAEAEIPYSDFMYNDMGSDGQYYVDSFKDKYTDNPFKTLYYFDGKNATVVTESMRLCKFTSESDSDPLVVYSEIEGGALPQVNVSDYVDHFFSTFTSLLAESLEEQTVYSAAQSARSMDLGLDDVVITAMSSDGTLYIGADYDEDEDTASIYQVTLGHGKVKECTLMERHVYSVEIAGGVDFIYWKNYEDYYHADLYVNGEKVDTDVAWTQMGYYYLWNYDPDHLYYLTDYDYRDVVGTLRCWNGKESVTIAKDVYTYIVAPDGQLLYLSDYDIEAYSGKLYSWDGKKSTLIANDVAAFHIISNG